MSGYGDPREYSGRDDKGSKRRSISPRDDSRGTRGGSRYSSGSSRYGSRDDRGYRDDRRSYPSSHTSFIESGTSRSINMPMEAQTPETGRNFAPSKVPVQGTIGRFTKVYVNHFAIQSLPVVKTYIYDVGEPNNLPGALF